jgi:hypothetical protein
MCIRDSYRNVTGELAEQLDGVVELPDLAAPRDLPTVMWPTDLVVPRSFGADQRVIGIAFDCRWDPGHGVGVRIVDEAVDEVGPQDIIL